jgi:GntR family transcriptional regulator
VAGSLRKRDRAREHLLGLVESRAVGQAIPSERQLSAELEISRPTLRAVVDDLVRDGRLVREHGRGMFVGSPKVAQQISGTHGATYPAAPGTWTSRVLSHATIQAGTLIGSRLRVAPNTAVLRIARQRFVNDDPICLETIHVLEEIVPGFDVQAIEQNSFYALLEGHLRRNPDRRGTDPRGGSGRRHRVRLARPRVRSSDSALGANHS